MGNECKDCSKESCEGCPSRQNRQSFAAPMNPDSNVKHVIGIISGKGGVGKSSVTAMLAAALRRKGLRVGILDADITGPSIPRMFGVSEPGGMEGKSLIPAVTSAGIKVMSINLILDNEDQPVIWRGPVIGGVVKQFWSDVIWGELDYLLVDMPPGTGDVALTVFQSLPVDGVLIVSSPQSLVEMVVKKAYHMAEMMKIPVLGVVENFSYVLCPDCGRKLSIFGESHLADWCRSAGVPLCASLPLTVGLSEYADTGAMESFPAEGFDSVIACLPQ